MGIPPPGRSPGGGCLPGNIADGFGGNCRFGGKFPGGGSPPGGGKGRPCGGDPALLMGNGGGNGILPGGGNVWPSGSCGGGKGKLGGIFGAFRLEAGRRISFILIL